jgi:hypothetical protein
LHAPGAYARIVEDYDSGWGEEPIPILRRQGFRSTVIFVVIVTFVMLTLMSTCSPRTTPIGTTTTTIDGITA